MIVANGGYRHWWQVKLDVPTSLFQLEFKTGTNQILSVDAAADYTAKLIGEQYDNLYLLMSGGIDSEYVAEVLYRNKIPFTPIIAITPENGDQSYFYAIHWCEQHSIQPVVLEYQVDDIKFQRACAKVIKNYGITSDVFCIMLLIDEVIARGGHVLMGEPSLILEEKNSRWSDPIGDTFDAGYHSCFGSIYTKGTHPCEFFLYTPELLLSLARSLDTDANISVAKSKLYNLPLKTKTWPGTFLTKDTKEKILKICHADHLLEWLCHRWQRDELIKLLTIDN